MEESVKRTLLMLAVALFAMNAEAGSTWFKTIDAAQKEAKKKNQLIFVDLFAEWCGWCKRAEQDIFPSEKFQKATDDMVLLRLDTEDRGEGTRLASNMGVTSLPTFLVLTDDLVVAGMIRGYAETDVFSAQVVKTKNAWADELKELSQDYANNPGKQLEVIDKLLARHGYARAEGRLKTLLTMKNIPAETRSKSYYNLAVAQIGQGNSAGAMKTLEQLEHSKPSATIAEDAAFMKAQIYLQQNQLKPALAEFKRFKTKYPNSENLQFVNAVIPQLESALKKAQ